MSLSSPHFSHPPSCLLCHWYCSSSLYKNNYVSLDPFLSLCPPSPLSLHTHYCVFLHSFSLISPPLLFSTHSSPSSATLYQDQCWNLYQTLAQTTVCTRNEIHQPMHVWLLRLDPYLKTVLISYCACLVTHVSHTQIELNMDNYVMVHHNQ